MFEHDHAAVILRRIDKADSVNRTSQGRVELCPRFGKEIQPDVDGAPFVQWPRTGIEHGGSIDEARFVIAPNADLGILRRHQREDFWR